MAGIVKIDYRVGGEDAVLRSFKTILQASQAQAKETVKIARKAAGDVVSIEQKAARDKVKVLDKAAAAVLIRSKRAQDAEETGIRKMQSAKGALMAKDLREMRKLADSKALEAKRGLDKMAADHARAEKQKEARENASANRSVARTTREAAMRERAERRMETRKAAVRAMEERKGHRISTAMEMAKIDDINHRRGAVRGAVGDAVKRGVSSGVGIIQAGAGLVGGYLGTQTIVDAGRAQLNLGKRAALLQNATDGKAGGIVEQAKSISNIVGEDAGDIMGGFEKVAAKSGAGGLEAVREHFLDLAKVAKGAGVEMGDLGDVVATLINRGIPAKDLVKTVEALVQQGKDGAVEFKDLATMLDASSGALGRFDMDENKRIVTAGGLSQLARTYGKKSPEEATNAVEDLARDLGGKGDIVQRLTGGKVLSTKLIGGKKTQVLGGGVEVGTDATRAQLKDVNDLLPDIIEKAFKNGNAGKLMGEGGIFTGNSTAIVAPLIQAYNKGITKDANGRFQLTGKGQTSELTGKAAAAELLKQFQGGDTPAGASDKAFQNVMQSGAGQIEVAMNRLKNDLGDKLGPEIAKATPAITTFIGKFGELTIWAMSNPFKAIMGIMAASVAQSLIGTGASSLFDKLLSKAIPSMAVTAGTVNVVGGPGAGGAGGAASVLGGAGATGGAAMLSTGLAAVAAIGVAGYGVLSGSSGQAKAENDRQSALNIGGFQAAGDLRRNNTEANRSAAVNALGDLELAKSDNNVISRFGAGVAGGFKGLAKGDVSLENIVTAIPQLALLRGAGNAVYGAAGEDKKGTDSAIADLRDALAKSNEPSIQAMNATTAAIQALPAAMAAAGSLQQPKAQP